MPLLREEQETVVRIGFYDETLSICTTNPTHARRYIKAGLVPVVGRMPSKWEEKEDRNGNTVRGKVLEYEETSWIFTAPADWFQHPRPKKRVSEAQRVAAAERMRKMHGKDEDDGEDDD
jgi:hypothetical protein